MKLNKMVNSEQDIEIKGVTADSREVKKGFLLGLFLLVLDYGFHSRKSIQSNPDLKF